MDKKTDHEFENIKIPQKEESQFVVPCEKQHICKEMEDLGPLFQAIKTTPEYPSWAQIEKAKSRLMNEINHSGSNFITTLKDRLNTTDSLVSRCFFYMALIIVMAVLAAGAFFLFEYLTATPAEAAVIKAFSLLA